MRWNHEPARRGVGDGFGLCGDSCENFGPVSTPCIGSSEDTGTSFALYANDLIYHNGKVLYTIPGSRNIPNFDSNDEKKEDEEGEPKKKKSRADKENQDIGDEIVPKKKKETKGKNSAPKVEDVKVEDRAPLFGKNSFVTCIFDTATEGGSLKFMIDKILLDIEITQVYSFLGSTEVFPTICLCPFDKIEDVSQIEGPTQVQPDQKENEDDNEDNEDEDNDEDAAAAAIAAETEAAELAAVEALGAAEELGKEPSVTLLPPGWEEEERLHQEALAAKAEKERQQKEVDQASSSASQEILIPIHDHPLISAPPR